MITLWIASLFDVCSFGAEVGKLRRLTLANVIITLHGKDCQNWSSLGGPKSDINKTELFVSNNYY